MRYVKGSWLKLLTMCKHQMIILLENTYLLWFLLLQNMM